MTSALARSNGLLSHHPIFGARSPNGWQPPPESPIPLGARCARPLVAPCGALGGELRGPEPRAVALLSVHPTGAHALPVPGAVDEHGPHEAEVEERERLGAERRPVVGAEAAHPPQPLQGLGLRHGGADGADDGVEHVLRRRGL